MLLWIGNFGLDVNRLQSHNPIPAPFDCLCFHHSSSLHPSKIHQSPFIFTYLFPHSGQIIPECPFSVMNAPQFLNSPGPENLNPHSQFIPFNSATKYIIFTFITGVMDQYPEKRWILCGMAFGYRIRNIWRIHCRTIIKPACNRYGMKNHVPYCLGKTMIFCIWR